jgi:hypothetical protein
VFSNAEDFTGSENRGFLKTGADTYTLRLEDQSVVSWRKGESGIPESWVTMIETIERQYGYLAGTGE